MAFHPILQKLIEKHSVEELANNTGISSFFKSISDAFYINEHNNEIAKQAFGVSENEFKQINTSLTNLLDQKKKSIFTLKKTIAQLEKDADTAPVNMESDNLLDVVSYLQQLVQKLQLTGRDMEQAKLQAEKSARVKSDFLNVMSHEIRTPLNAIIGVAGLLAGDGSGSYQNENIKVLKFSSEHLLALVNDILDFSKLEEGKVKLEENYISIKRLADEVVKAYERKAREKNNYLELIMDQALPPMVLGDALRLKQILINLISNAVKFTADGHIIVNISLQKISSKNCEILFSVKDNGIGITAEKQKLIFEKFMQADSAIAKNYGGTGLGLAITRKILQLQGSEIYVNSQPGKGSEFFFTLVFKIAETNGLTGNKNQQSEEAPKDLNGRKILVVDDNKLNILIVSQFLKKWNAEVESCTCGEKALELAVANRYDLILMDLQMPGMDGFETSGKINSVHKNLPIVALTASTTEEIQKKVNQSCMADFIAKPFNADDMFRILLMHLEKN